MSNNNKRVLNDKEKELIDFVSKYDYKHGTELEEGYVIDFETDHGYEVIVGSGDKSLFINIKGQKRRVFLRNKDKWVKIISQPEFELPEKWCIKADNSKIIQSYFQSIETNNDIRDYVSYGYLNEYFHFPKYEYNNTLDLFVDKNIKQGYTEITTEQFKQYVLKTKTTMDKKYVKCLSSNEPENFTVGQIYKLDEDGYISSDHGFKYDSSKFDISKFYPEIFIFEWSTENAGNKFKVGDYVDFRWIGTKHEKIIGYWSPEIMILEGREDNKCNEENYILSKKQDDIIKAGDWIKVTKDGNNKTTHNKYSQSYSHGTQPVLKVLKVEPDCLVCEGGYVIHTNYGGVRKATKSEISVQKVDYYEVIKDIPFTNYIKGYTIEPDSELFEKCPSYVNEYVKPVYKSKEIVLELGNPKRKIIITKDKISSQGREFPIGEIEATINNGWSKKGMIGTTEITLTKASFQFGCKVEGSELTLDELKQIVKEYKSLHNGNI